MGQVSRPMLIALALTVALAAVWLVALRPKPVAVENTPLAPTKAVPAAKQASAASDAANAKREAAGNAVDPSPSAPAAPAKPATADAVAQPAAKAASQPGVTRGENGRERAVLREVRRGKVVVMLFWNSGAADDVATRRAVEALDRRRGKVKVHMVAIGRVADYGSITRGVRVAQSPTTLIIGSRGRARTIVGLTESEELRQAVADAIAKR